MKVEYKSVAVGGVSEIKDEGDGIVVAYVSVTGVEDNVKDIIEPGAYTSTLTKRMPKGIWSHDWKSPTAKTLEAKELMPGDPDLPKELSDGSPWPKEAGALRIKMQFNLGTKRGREAYSDVVFFDKDQEWSIGYLVPDGASTKDSRGRRRIKTLELYEYSPVLFGANSHARTAVSVKDAQFGAKMTSGVSLLEIKSLEDALALYRKEHGADAPDGESGDFEGDGPSELDVESALDEDDDAILDIDDESEEVDEDELAEMYDEEEAEAEEKVLMDRITASMSVKDIRSAYGVLGKLLDVVQPDTAYEDLLMVGTKALIEAKAVGYDTIADAVDAIDIKLSPTEAKTLRDAAEKLDWALKAGDQEAAEESATDLMDTLEELMDANPDGELSLKVVARTIADKAAGTEPGDDEEEDDTDEEIEDDEEDEEDTETKSFRYVADSGVEYKNGPWAGRTYGAPVGGKDLPPRERVNAFVCGLRSDVLGALEVSLREVPGNASIKQMVADEVETRQDAGAMPEIEVKTMGAVKKAVKKTLKRAKTVKKAATRKQVRPATKTADKAPEAEAVIDMTEIKGLESFIRGGSV